MIDTKSDLFDNAYAEFPVSGVSDNDFVEIVGTIIDNDSSGLCDESCHFSNSVAIYEGVKVRMMSGQGTAYNMYLMP
jgi:hypothetical protein